MSEGKCLTDKVVVVTGAGRGIGRAIAELCAAQGAKVVVNDLGGSADGEGSGDAHPAEEVVDAIRKAGGQAVANFDSVADAGPAANIIKTAIDSFGRIDCVINNAGILRDRSFGKMSDAEWNAVIAVHLTGSANCARSVWNQMKEQGYGRILMTTSTSGIYGNFGQANYGAAKMGVIGMMNTLCIEGMKSNIRINCLAPTAATRMTEDIMTEEMLAALDPKHVTPAAVYLVSRDAPNRTVMFAGGGTFSKLEIRESKGVFISEDERNADSVAARFEAISDMSAPDHFTNGNEHIAKVLTNTQKAAS